MATEYAQLSIISALLCNSYQAGPIYTHSLYVVTHKAINLVADDYRHSHEPEVLTLCTVFTPPYHTRAAHWVQSTIPSVLGSQKCMCV